MGVTKTPPRVVTVNKHDQQDCIPVGGVPTAYCRYLPACTVQGGV